MVSITENKDFPFGGLRTWVAHYKLQKISKINISKEWETITIIINKLITRRINPRT